MERSSFNELERKLKISDEKALLNSNQVQQQVRWVSTSNNKMWLYFQIFLASSARATLPSADRAGKLIDALNLSGISSLNEQRGTAGVSLINQIEKVGHSGHEAAAHQRYQQRMKEHNSRQSEKGLAPSAKMAAIFVSRMRVPEQATISQQLQFQDTMKKRKAEREATQRKILAQLKAKEDSKKNQESKAKEKIAPGLFLPTGFSPPPGLDPPTTPQRVFLRSSRMWEQQQRIELRANELEEKRDVSLTDDEKQALEFCREPDAQYANSIRDRLPRAQTKALLLKCMYSAVAEITPLGAADQPLQTLVMEKIARMRTKKDVWTDTHQKIFEQEWVNKKRYRHDNLDFDNQLKFLEEHVVLGLRHIVDETMHASLLWQKSKERSEARLREFKAGLEGVASMPAKVSERNDIAAWKIATEALEIQSKLVASFEANEEALLRSIAIWAAVSPQGKQSKELEVAPEKATRASASNYEIAVTRKPRAVFNKLHPKYKALRLLTVEEAGYEEDDDTKPEPFSRGRSDSISTTASQQLSPLSRRSKGSTSTPSWTPQLYPAGTHSAPPSPLSL